MAFTAQQRGAPIRCLPPPRPPPPRPSLPPSATPAPPALHAHQAHQEHRANAKNTHARAHPFIHSANVCWFMLSQTPAPASFVCVCVCFLFFFFCGFCVSIILQHKRTFPTSSLSAVGSQLSLYLLSLNSSRSRRSTSRSSNNNTVTNGMCSRDSGRFQNTQTIPGQPGRETLTVSFGKYYA